VSKNKKRHEDVVEVKAETVETVEETVEEIATEETPVTEEVQEVPVELVEPPSRPVLEVQVYRDDEGRLVLETQGKKRIAGNDEAFAEVTRQFGAQVVTERLI
jgi:hypothetical protein